MRYAKGHKEATRQRITEVASQRFRRDGIDGVGLATLMADAGLTHGGFYSHFESKQELVGVAAAEAMAESFESLSKQMLKGGGIEALAKAYLSTRHRDHPEQGCAAASLAADLARQPHEVRAAFTERLEHSFALIEAQLPASLSAATRRDRAMAIFGLLLGNLQLARASTDASMSRQLLRGGIEAAVLLAHAPG